VFLSDVEKVKVIDALVVTAGRDMDDDVANIARDLLQRYSIDFCQRAVVHMHNGNFATLRLYVFEAHRVSKRIHTPTTHTDALKMFDTIEAAMFMTHDECTQPAVRSLVNTALANLADLRAGVNSTLAVQLLYSLQFSIAQIITILCAPNLLLCVHSGVDSGRLKASVKPARCGNPSCESTSTDLLKCSACKTTYYCSSTCQRADWKNHKGVCKGGLPGKADSLDNALIDASDDDAGDASNVMKIVARAPGTLGRE
jgi:hypothetical protein